MQRRGEKSSSHSQRDQHQTRRKKASSEGRGHEAPDVAAPHMVAEAPLLPWSSTAVAQTGDLHGFMVAIEAQMLKVERKADARDSRVEGVLASMGRDVQEFAGAMERRAAAETAACRRTEERLDRVVASVEQLRLEFSSAARVAVARKHEGTGRASDDAVSVVTRVETLERKTSKADRELATKKNTGAARDVLDSGAAVVVVAGEPVTEAVEAVAQVEGGPVAAVAAPAYKKPLFLAKKQVEEE